MRTLLPPSTVLASLALTLTLALTGCESTPHYNRTKVVTLTTPLPKRPYDSVKLYQRKEDVTEPYDVIAILSVDGNPGEEAMFIKAFLYRAADLGADGVIFQRSSSDGKHAVYRGEAIRRRGPHQAPLEPAVPKA